ncbi:cation transporting ATPase [Plasmodium brasilianum]|uniref:Cation transporting ATPase n=1 Tax=Plasmodium brasilianum TaxID=5824 RepID=A0ACB9YH02_PLABR|nr:cation transporting ATPase [Plasmodium brasilianum]
MKSKYNMQIYRKRKTHLRLDVLLFFFYVVFLNLILQNKKFEAQPSDYEYIEKSKNEIKEENIFKFKNSIDSSDQLKHEQNMKEHEDQLYNELEVGKNEIKDSVEFPNNEKGSSKEKADYNNSNNGKEKEFNNKNRDNSFKPIIIGKYNLIYIFYSVEFVSFLLFMFFHLLIFLISQWNLNVNLLVCYIHLNNTNQNKYIYNLKNLCTHVCIKPLTKKNDKSGIHSKERFNTDYNLYKPKSELVELKKGKNDIFIFYKQKKYIFNYKTLDFESVKHFDIFNLSFYLKWNGLIEFETDDIYDEINMSHTLRDIEESVNYYEDYYYHNDCDDRNDGDNGNDDTNNLNALFSKIDALYLGKRNDIAKSANKSNKMYNELGQEEGGNIHSTVRGRGKKSKQIHTNETLNKSHESNFPHGDINKNKKKVEISEIKNDGSNNDPFFYDYKKKNYFEIPYDIYVHNNLSKYGENIYDIPSPCFKKLLYEAMLSPFFVFQFFSIILWMLDSYWYFGIFSIFILIVLEAQLINKRIREFNLINSMKVPAQNVYVYRNLQWKIIKSNMLLPGDIYILSNEIRGSDNICTCETLLLEGVCITDESILTGESVPLIKAAIDKNVEEENDVCIKKGGEKNGNRISIFSNKIDIKNKHKKHIVYAGSNILLTKNENNEFKNKKLPISGCIGIVIKNGFTTYQGKLVRTIINTSEKVNASSTDSIIFLIILLLFSLFACAYVVYSVLKANKERNLYGLLLSVSHIITAVISPEFPITLSLGVTISIVYLYNLKIYCTEPFRLPFSGKSNICAFDKTGTLTEDNMIVLGLFGLDNNIEKINDINKSIISRQKVPFFSVAVIAGCHSLCTVNNKLLGDPLEKNSFLKLKCMMKSLDSTYVYTNNKNNSSSSSSNNNNSNDYKSVNSFSKKLFSFHNEKKKSPCLENFQIYKRFFFSSELQRMTCIVLHEGYEEDWYGEEYEESFTPCKHTTKVESDKIINENIAILDNLKKRKKKDNSKNEPTKQYLVLSKGSPEMMKKFLKKIPENYDEVLNSLSIRGYRVLCLAANVLDNKIISKNVRREDIEKDLFFCGFLTFICPIKTSTPEYIIDIKNAGIKNIMITGDNALTACQVAQDVNIIPSVKSKDILILKLKEDYSLNDRRIRLGPLSQSNEAIEQRITKSLNDKISNDLIGSEIFSNQDKVDAIEMLYSIGKSSMVEKNVIEKVTKIIEKNKNVSSRIYFIDRENKKMLPFIDNEEYIKLCEHIFSLCITGDIIDYFLNNYQNDLTLFNELIKRVHIFCRVSPKHKEIIIKTLNKLGNISIMCGDGTNDMAALKAAHVGISLLSIKISYKNKEIDNSNNNKQYNANSLNTYDKGYNNYYANSENHFRNPYNNLYAPYNSSSTTTASSGSSNMNAKYYEQMKKYNERKQALENMMQSIDDSLPLIKLGEASIASPFTYKGNDIKCVKEIICCGRCALAKVIMMYKLMIINSLITAFSVSILTLDGVKLSDAQTTVISLLYTSLIVLISKTTPLENISNYSPPNSLFNISVIASLICQVFVHFFILIYGWKLASSYREPDYVPDLKGDIDPNIVNTCIYYLIYCINLSIFSSNYEGLPFMIPLHKNKEIIFIFISNIIFLFSLVLNILPFLNYFFSLVSFPNFHLQLVFLFLMISDIVVPYIICNFIRYLRFYSFTKFNVRL